MAEQSTKIVLTAEDRASAAIGKVGNALGGLANPAAAASAALGSLAGGAALTGLGAIAKAAIDAADNLNDLSQRTGIAVKDLAGYKLAAEQSGTSLEGVAKGMKSMATAMFDNRDALKAAGITATDTSGAMRQLADLFSKLPDGAEKSALATKLLGKAGQDLIPLLNLGSQGLDESAAASERYGAAMAKLAPQADQFNDTISRISLNLQSMGAELAGELAPTLNVIAEAMGKSSESAVSLSTAGVALKTFFETISVLGANVAFVFEGVGRELGAIAAQIAALGRGDLTGFKAISEAVKADAERARAELEKFERRVMNPVKPKTGPSTYDARDLRKQADEQAEAYKRARAALDASDLAAANKKAAAEALAVLKQQYANRLEAIKEGLAAEDQALKEARARGEIDERAYLEKLADAQRQSYAARAAALKQQLASTSDASDRERLLGEVQKLGAEAAKAASAATVALLELDQAAQKALNTLAGVAMQEAIDIGLDNDKLREELDTLGMTTEQLAAYRIAKLEVARDTATTFAQAVEDAAAAITDEGIAAQQAKQYYLDLAAAKRAAADKLGEQITLVNQTAIKQQAVDAAKESTKAWENFSRDIEQSLTDALMRSFESGDSFGEAFAKNLQNTFKSMILKVAVQAVVDPVMGGVKSMMGIGQTAGGAGNLLSAGSNIVSMFNGGAAQAAGSGLMEFGSAIGSDAIGHFGAEMMMGEGLAGGVGTALPYIGGALAVASLLGAFDSKGGPKDKWTAGDVVLDNKASGRSTSGEAAAAAMAAETTVASIAKLFDKKLGDIAVQMYGTSDPAGTAKDQAGIAYRVNGAMGVISGIEAERGQGLSAAELAERTSQAAIAVLEKIDLGKLANDYLDQFASSDAIKGLNAEQANAILATVQSIDAFTDAVRAIQPAISDLDLAALAGAFGDINAASAALANYYDLFYTEQEKLDKLAQQVGDAFADINLSMPATKEEFRALVESLDLTTTSGQQAYAALMGLAPAFAQVADAAQKTVDDLVGRVRADTAATARRAFDAVSRSIDAEIERIESTLKADLGGFDQQLDGLTRIIDSATSLVESLDDAIASLRNQVAGPQQTVEQARSNIDRMLAEAFAGALPDQNALADALQAVTADNPNDYATREDWIRAQAVQAGKLDTLAKLTKRQGDGADDQLDLLRSQRDAIEKSAAEQIAALNNQRDLASQQLEALDGIEQGIMSLAEALANFQITISQAAGVRITQPNQTTKNPATGNAIASAYYEYLGRAPDAGGYQYWQDQVASGTPVTSVISSIANSAEAQVNQLYDSLLGRAPDSAGAQYWTDLISAGTSIQAITDAIKQSDEYRTLQGFAVGTNYVPQTGVALIHEGERIIPAADNRELMKRLNDNSNVIDITPLLQEIAALRAEVRAGQGAIASNTRQTKDLLDSTINGSNTLRTEAVA